MGLCIPEIAVATKSDVSSDSSLFFKKQTK